MVTHYSPLICPACASSEVTADETVPGTRDVLGWRSDGILVLEDAVDVSYGDAETTGLHCRDCGTSWSLPDFVEVEERCP